MVDGRDVSDVDLHCQDAVCLQAGALSGHPFTAALHDGYQLYSSDIGHNLVSEQLDVVTYSL
jgi:hypothetical protein